MLMKLKLIGVGQVLYHADEFERKIELGRNSKIIINAEDLNIHALPENIGNAIKEQVIESGTNLAVDALRGNNLRDGINREVNTFKERGAEGIEHLRKGRNKLQTRKYNGIDVTPKKNYGKISY